MASPLSVESLVTTSLATPERVEISVAARRWTSGAGAAVAGAATVRPAIRAVTPTATTARSFVAIT
jgi:hypothetical protein